MCKVPVPVVADLRALYACSLITVQEREQAAKINPSTGGHRTFAFPSMNRKHGGAVLGLVVVFLDTVSCWSCLDTVRCCLCRHAKLLLCYLDTVSCCLSRYSKLFLCCLDMVSCSCVA